MWMGIGVTLTSLMLYAKEMNPQFAINKKILSVGVLILIMITGHLGGSLTHGSDYLTKPLADVFGSDSIPNTTIKPVPNAQEALAYNDVIKPILQTKCYNCHGPNKQKGKLRMDDVAMLMKGGKDGKVIEPGNADGSEMIRRLLLPVDNEDLRLLLALKKQMIWLKLGYTNISDSAMATIAQLNSLTRLGLQHTTISDKGVHQLQALQNLQYLNLVGTRVTAQGVLQLKGLKALHSLYLYQTNVNKADWATLQNAFPKTQIDSGGYSVAMLATDTTEVKAKKEY